MSYRKPIHPRVKAAAGLAAVIATGFSFLAGVGVIVPDDVQNAATILIVDAAAFAPVVYAWSKRVIG